MRMTEKHEIQSLVEQIYQTYHEHEDGAVADYIPQLSLANPEHFGISILSTNGTFFEYGDTNQLFTIQSISKPLVYGMALEIFGKEEVEKKIDIEPSGEAFNSIELQPQTNRPFNPMVNAGAIAATGMLHDKYGKDSIDFIFIMDGKYCL